MILGAGSSEVWAVILGIGLVIVAAVELTHYFSDRDEE